MLFMIFKKASVGSQVCLVMAGGRGFPEIAEVQAEICIHERDRGEWELGRMGGEGRSRKREGCWGMQLLIL